MSAQTIEDAPANPEEPAPRLRARMPSTDDVSHQPLRQFQRMDEDAGTTLNRLGVYQMKAALGQGGMGEVFLAWDERLGRHVAIKRIRSDKPLDEIHHARFRREARAVARVSHPAIVQVYDVFEAADGSDCIVMEHVDGKCLAELLKRRAVETDLALRLAAEIADGLAEAHAKGLIHRDLKAENVMVTSSGHAKILDFGLARALWPAVPGEDEARLSDSGMLVGTAHAMSPEQAGGQNVDHRSDLFALGSLLYEMLTGSAPFRGTNLLDSLRRVISVDAEPLGALRGDLPPELGALLGRLLAKDPGKRPQNARLVADELEQIRVRMAFQAESSGTREGAGNLESLPTLAGTPRPSHVETYGAVSDGSVVVRTLVMTDLVRSTQLIESLGDERAFEIFGHHDRTARDLLKKLGGLEIDKSDGFLLLFERPADAVAYALAYHRSLERLSKDEGVELAARVGIHLGEIRLRRNPSEDVSRGAKPMEVEGIAKPTAARVMSLAGPRQTLLTRTAFDLARRVDAVVELAEPDLRWLAHGAYAFQGVEESIEIFEVGEEGVSPLVEPEDSDKARRMVSIQEELVLGWRPAAGQGIPRRRSWVLLEKVGQGGFGEVWLARHKSGEKRVFKFCFEAHRLRGLKREVTLFRLLKEALGHREDIARILDWNFEVAPFYLEAEYTEDGNLADWVELEGGAAEIPLATRLSLVADVAEALAAAHSVGVLHKDVKPENILVTHDHDGRVRAQLTDFGIGLLTDRERLDSGSVTVMGFTASASTLGSSEGGTLGYMAPEVMQGRAATVQADIYSLGVMLYQMVVGDFDRALATGWRRDVEDEILVEDIASCVDGVPARRPASALAVAEGLRRLEERRAEREAQRRAKREAAEARRALARAQRRRKVFLAVAVAAGLVLAIVSTLAVQAMRARRDAELWRSQGANLLSFMFGDLQDKLQPIGRLDILDGVGDQAMAYFESVPRADLSARELLGMLEALNQIGNVRLLRGQHSRALEAFEQARDVAQELVERDPSDPMARKTLGESHYWVSYIALRQGDLDAALAGFQQFLSVAQELRDLEPDNPEWRLELVYAYTNIGSVLQRKGELSEALEIYWKCLSDIEALVAEDSGNEDYLTQLANSYNAVAYILNLQGKTRDALQFHRKELAVNTALADMDPDSAPRQENAAISHTFVGIALDLLGEVDLSLESFSTAAEIFERLTAIDSSNLTWRRHLARNYMKIGSALEKKGELQEAIEKHRLSVAMMEEVVTAEPADRRWMKDLTESRVLLGWALLRSGDLKAAKAEASGALEKVEKLLSTDTKDDSVFRLKGMALVLQGDIWNERGAEELARASWASALEWMDRTGQGIRDIGYLEVKARTLRLLGRVDEARSITRELEEIGYVRPATSSYEARDVGSNPK